MPQLRSTNWERTRAFYERGLGFHVDWEHRFEPGFPVVAQVTRDGRTLLLTEHAGGCVVDPDGNRLRFPGPVPVSP